MPAGQRACLITAQTSLRAIAQDANSAKAFPWRPDPNEIPADTINRLRFAQIDLLRTIEQADRNLIEVIRWSEGSEEGLPSDAK